jgi:hypothetical protein
MSRYTRWFALPVIVVWVSACSRHAGSQRDSELSRDPSLVLQLEPALRGQSQRFVSVARACLPLPHAAPPTAEQQAEAHALVMQGHQMAIVGNSSTARDLFRRAVQLDPTNASAAYLAARASDVANDSTEALEEYCRYLSLAPTSSAAASVRQRIFALARPRSQPFNHLASRVASSRSMRTHGLSRRNAAAAFVSARRSDSPSTVFAGDLASPIATDSAVEATSDGEAHAHSSPGPAGESTTVAADAHEQRGDSTGGEVTGRDAPSPRQREGHTARTVLISVAAGAAAGAAIGRNVKGAVIGAAAGGLLGVLVARADGANPD